MHRYAPYSCALVQVRDQPVGVTEKGAVHLFDPVPVRERVPVNGEVRLACERGRDDER